MNLIVNKSALSGTAAMPASKSHTIRAVAIASLADGQSKIRHPLVSSDTLSAVSCYRALGAKIDTRNAKVWEITGTAGKIIAPTETIDVGNSGTTLRIAASSAALADTASQITLTGDRQIQSRPIGPLITALKDLGANAKAIKNNGKAPIKISGGLIGGNTTIQCTTSQYLSSLLLAAPLVQNDTDITVTMLNEPDYVQMTLDWLDKQDIDYENDQMKRFRIKGGQKYKPFDLPIPADFSSATFFLCAGAILDADITLTGLDFDDSQPDKAVAEYLRKMGADITIEKNTVRIKGSKLTAAEIDMNKTPDALPAIAVTAAFAGGTTKLFNVAQARSKETDRIACMCCEMKKTGAKIEELPDGLVIKKSKLRHADLNGHSDHRIVMALSLAAMAIDGQTCITTAQAVNVTFPNYVELMKKLGAKMKMMP